MTLEMPTSAEEIRDQWDAVAAGWDEHTTSVTMSLGERLLRHIAIGDGVRLLDVAAGTGAVALPAARLGADVVAIDISPAMVDRLAARARAEGLDNVTARAMDGTALDLADDSFDVAISSNGVSTFPDVDAGLAEMARVTQPRGRVAVAASGPPQRVEFAAFGMAALQAVVPGFEPPPLELAPPFQLSDPGEVRRRLEKAGLGGVQVETLTWGMHFTSAAHLWGFLTGNPIGAGLTAGLSAEQQAAGREVLDGMLRERSGGAPGAVLDIELNIGVATKP